MPTALKIGDKIEVLDEGLAMLRRLVPDAPPNHHGTVVELLSHGRVMVQFDDGDQQVAPYPPEQIRLR